jgi:hypothetical protein
MIELSLVHNVDLFTIGYSARLEYPLREADSILQIAKENKMKADVPQFERYWREKIAEEVADLIERVPSINAHGVYMYLKENKHDSLE